MPDLEAPLFRIEHVESGPPLEEVRRMFFEYSMALGVDLCFQDFESELAGLPGDYARPLGRLLLATRTDEPGTAAGCVALRPLEAWICEMKRLYVRPAARGAGLGRQLAERIVHEAREAGYARMRLDTLPAMTEALGLYERLGFRDIAPYRHNPISGARYLELRL